MTVAAVAKRAGVSRATAYRYFVSNDAVTVWATRPTSAEPGAPELPVSPEPEALGDRAARLVREQGVWAFEHERELRALLALSLAPDAEERGVARRGKCGAPSGFTRDCCSTSRTASPRSTVPGWLLRSPPCSGSDAVVWTRDAAELDRDQSLDVMAWIARTLVEATVRDP
jgi:AcrR family transcriptional regulator